MWPCSDCYGLELLLPLVIVAAIGVAALCCFPSPVSMEKKKEEEEEKKEEGEEKEKGKKERKDFYLSYFV